MREALLVEVKSGKIRHSPWQRIHINDDGYLFVADKNGHLVWVQLVNYEKMMGHELTLPEVKEKKDGKARRETRRETRPERSNPDWNGTRH